jgi:hypothetical protein
MVLLEQPTVEGEEALAAAITVQETLQVEIVVQELSLFVTLVLLAALVGR